MITLLVMCSALFARHGLQKNGGDVVPVMSYNTEFTERAGVTFTDLAERVNEMIVGVTA